MPGRIDLGVRGVVARVARFVAVRAQGVGGPRYLLNQASQRSKRSRW
jgi:hypothetical protein